MKESALIGMTWVRTHAPLLASILPSVEAAAVAADNPFQTMDASTDVHVHVPSGAIPKVRILVLEHPEGRAHVYGRTAWRKPVHITD